MLLTKMDLLNYQYLDKMNNNIGILCYEGELKWRVFFGAVCCCYYACFFFNNLGEFTSATLLTEVFTPVSVNRAGFLSANLEEKKVVALNTCLFVCFDL